MTLRIVRTHVLSLLTLVTLAASAISCGKEVGSTEALAPVTPASADAGAGSWKMLVLSGPA